MATADLYSVTLDDGRIISIYFQGVYADSLERFTEELGPIRTRQLRESHQEVPKDNTRILYLAGARGIRLGNGKTITDSQKERWLNKNTGFDIRDIYAEHNVEDKTENPELQEKLGGNDFNDPFELSDDVDAGDLLSNLLSNRGDRSNYFDRMSIDPAMAKGGTSLYRQGLEEAFNPVDAAFQLKGLLAPRGFEFKGLGGGGADALPRFADYEGGVPSVEDIRGQLTNLISRRNAGTLSESAEELLEDENRQGRLISAATNSRSTPGFMRNAIRDAIAKKIQRKQYEAPGADLLNQFVNSGFRL